MFHNFLHFYAGVLELADEADSKSAACEGVWAVSYTHLTLPTKVLV